MKNNYTYTMDRINAYKKAYSLLETMTPLKEDCGELCDRACCKGDEKTGMLLFPGEELLFQADEGWYGLRDSEIFLSNGRCIKILTCKGTCPREKRPLACRIFPFMPYITEDDVLEFRMDLKSLLVCPLACDPEKYDVQEEFIDTLYDAFVDLIEYDEVFEFIVMLSLDYDDMVDVIL